RPGERVLLAGSVELKAALQDLESRPEKEADKPATDKPQLVLDPQSRPETRAAEQVAKGKAGGVPNPVSRPENKSKAVKG
ncbi:MAG: hypothetical protein ACXVB5_19510, partial [Isosphaeraceae bacterium]